MRQLSRSERLMVAALMNYYEGVEEDAHLSLDEDEIQIFEQIAQAIDARRNSQGKWQLLPDVSELAGLTGGQE